MYSAGMGRRIMVFPGLRAQDDPGHAEGLAGCCCRDRRRNRGEGPPRGPFGTVISKTLGRVCIALCRYKVYV